jgi:FlaA1/EpsC-like NDP-sugar epimerase
MILGAEDAGEMLLREIQRNPHSGYEVLGFFDDDSSKWGSKIHGIPILGSVESSSAFAERRGIKVAIVAIPSLAHARMRRIYEILKPLNVYVKTLPGVHEIIEGAPALTQLRDVNISDLLRREEVRIDTEQVNNLVHGKTILVTGAGGSIGSELCSQIYRRRPGLLVLMERAENALFETHRSLCGMAVSECAVIPYLCDVTDLARVNRAFRIYKPQLVFHAAAHKHVPLQELNASECFKNNVGGMRVLSHAAHEYASEVFVLVSTDKAVNPSSVMGATKRVCEMYGQAFAETSPTHFLSVRFGNVLASQGSVVPIFMDQISRGGPVTVTHPEMRRYFMTIPEAVTLILQAAVLGKSGEIMALEMGEPTRIVDLARHLIELMDGDPENIRIEYTGLRAGEKLYEEIRFDDEAYGKTTHEKIRTIHGPGKYGDHITGLVEKALERAGECADDDEIRRILKSLVPEYTA